MTIFTPRPQWIVDLINELAGGAGGVWGSITGTLSAQTDLQTALDGKQAAGSYAATSHTHAISDVTNLQLSLDDKLDDSQLDTDTALAANSDAKIATQKAVKAYVDNKPGLSNNWILLNQTGGAITATTATITIASPGVVTWAGHGLSANTQIVFATSGALPTGLTAGTIYYVRNPATDTFEVSATSGGASINTTGSQSGTHTAKRINSWDWGANVAQVDFTNLSSYSELMIVGNDVAKSISGVTALRLSVDNGSSFFSGASDYQFIASAGTVSVATLIGLHSTATTAARSSQTMISPLNVDGVIKTIECINRVDSTSVRFLGSVLPINAIRIFGGGGGDLTGGTLQVFGR